MRVGILTYHHTLNYGATLQAFSTRQAVERLGHQAHVIDFRHRKAVAIARAQVKRAPSRIEMLSRFIATRRFIRDELNLYPAKHFMDEGLLHPTCMDLDAVVTGSDEVFRIDGVRNNTTVYYLDFLPPDGPRRVSYAACSGITEDADQRNRRLSDVLGEFHAVSVRDHTTADYIGTLLGREPAQVLDPTFLADFSAVTTPPKDRSPYLLVYGPMSQPGEGRLVTALAERLNLRIVAAGHRHAIAHQNHLGASPQQWLGLFQHASYVYATYFHGVVFSIINRKPFATVLHEDKWRKIGDLLKKFELESRIVPAEQAERGDVGIDHLLTLDYATAEPHITRWTDQSRAFLSEALA
ncbi:MAG: polysaccharide pyruvyl transferase family protein [Planctomycetota bacterium]